MANNGWLGFAIGSAFFAALTAILGKLGVSEVNATLATFIRAAVILVVTAGFVTFRREWMPLDKLSTFGTLMLVLSSLATGLSWLCYYRALQLGPASKVAPVDKLSVVIVLICAVLFLGETLTWKTTLGGALIAAGVVLTALP